MNKLYFLFSISVFCILVSQPVFAIEAQYCTAEHIAVVKRDATRFKKLCDNFKGRSGEVTRRLKLVNSESAKNRLTKRQEAFKKSQDRYCSKLKLLNLRIKELTDSCPEVTSTPQPAVTPSSTATPNPTASPIPSSSPKPLPTPLGTATPNPTVTSIPKPSPTPFPTPLGTATLSPTPTPTSFPWWQIICSYPAPPIGCYYTNGPAFNPETQCGLILVCGVPRDKLG